MHVPQITALPVKRGTFAVERNQGLATGASTAEGWHVGGNRMARSLSFQFFITAVILALFGLAERSPSSSLSTGSESLGTAQLVLAVAMTGAGFYLRGATPASRVVGLCAAGATAAFGAYAMITGLGYVPGTIVAIYCVFHLVNADSAFADAAFTGTPSQTQAPVCDPQPPLGAAPFSPAPYGQSAPPAYPPAPAATSYFGVLPSQPAPASEPAPPAGPSTPPPTEPGGRPDPRFG